MIGAREALVMVGRRHWGHYCARACNEAPPPKEEYAPNALPEGA